MSDKLTYSDSDYVALPPGAAIEVPDGYDVINDTYFSTSMLSRLHNEWMRRYIEEPEDFQREFEAVLSFITDEDNGVEPSHGEECVAYLKLLASQEVEPNVFVRGGVAFKRIDMLNACLDPDTAEFGDFLLGLIDGYVPAVWPDQLVCSEVSIRDGWKVGVRWDHNRFGSLDYFMTPSGKMVDFYKWEEADTDRRLITEWRPNEDDA